MQKKMTKLNYEEILQRDGKYIFTPVGTSMLPVLRERRDTVLVEKKTKKLKKHDVALYKRKSGDYVLHRVMAVGEDGYTFCGDNQTTLENGVTDDMVLGVMTAFWRDEKKVEITSLSYRLYTKIWCLSLSLRRIMQAFTRRLFK